MSIKEKMAWLFRSGLTLISPKLNTKVCYRVKFHRKLDLEHPVTLDDKILWLKFHDYWNNSLVKQCADKYQVREYIKDLGYPEILNTLIATYTDGQRIDWEKLPNSFVVKLNVGCGKNLIVRDKAGLNVAEAERAIRRWFKAKDWLGYSEMQYKGVEPVLMIESCLCGEDGSLPADYKFYCLNGKAEFVMVCEGRENGGHAKFYYYDRNWTLKPFTQEALDDPDHITKKPAGIEKAFEYAESLAVDFPFVRVDLYLIDGRVYFGELTFTPSGGLDNGRLTSTDRLLGEMLVLPCDRSDDN